MRTIRIVDDTTSLAVRHAFTPPYKNDKLHTQTYMCCSCAFAKMCLPIFIHHDYHRPYLQWPLHRCHSCRRLQCIKPHDCCSDGYPRPRTRCSLSMCGVAAGCRTANRILLPTYTFTGGRAVAGVREAAAAIPHQPYPTLNFILSFVSFVVRWGAVALSSAVPFHLFICSNRFVLIRLSLYLHMILIYRQYRLKCAYVCLFVNITPLIPGLFASFTRCERIY